MTQTHWLDFVAVVFATGAIIEVWQKGSLFANVRAYLNALQDVTPPETAKGRLLELLHCPFFAADWLGGAWPYLVRLVVYGWAATRISNLIDGTLPNRLRYRPNIFEGDEP
jgi:hypothetical protein